MEELSRRKKELERLVEVRGTKHINNSNHRREDSKGHGKITYGKTGHITGKRRYNHHEKDAARYGKLGEERTIKEKGRGDKRREIQNIG